MGIRDASPSAPTAKKTTTPSSSGGGFFHAVGDFLHDLVFEDPAAHAAAVKAGAPTNPSPTWLKAIQNNAVVRTATNVAGALAAPILHPVEFAKLAGNEVNEALYKPIIGLFGERDVPVIGHVPAQTVKGNLGLLTNPSQLYRSPGVRMLPGAGSLASLAEGKAPSAEQAILDALGLFGGEIGASGKLSGEGRLHPILQKGSNLAGDVTDLLSRSVTGRAAVRGAKKTTSKIRESFPTARTALLKPLPVAGRASVQDVSRVIGADMDAIAEMNLVPLEREALRHNFLDKGIRPEDAKMATAFDRIKAWEAADREAKLNYTVGEEVVQGLKSDAGSKWYEKNAKTSLGPERSRLMFEAFDKGADNPFPDYSKAWNRLKIEHRRMVRTEGRKGRLYEFDSGLRMEEPPIPDGFVRLYRGEGNALNPLMNERPAMGSWYSPRKDVAEGYASRAPDGVGSLKYVDISQYNYDDLAHSMVGGGMGYDDVWEIGLPKEVFEQALPISQFKTEVLPWEDFIAVGKAKAKWLDGEMAMAEYEAILDLHAPGRFKPALREAQLARQIAAMRLKYEKGFGAAAYKAAIDAIPETYTVLAREFARQGLDGPVWMPRIVKDTESEPMPRFGPEFTTEKPDVTKPTGRREADRYHDEPVAMMMHNQYEITNRVVVQKAIAEVRQRTGAKLYEVAVEDEMLKGHSRVQAESIVQNDWAYLDLNGKTGKPEAGKVLVRRDVAKGVEQYVTKVMPSLWDRAFGAWMIPVLHLSLSFHVNNILGGAFLVALNAHEGPLALLHYTREALDIMKKGEMDPRIPLGMGQGAQFEQRFTKESRIAEGGRLAGIFKKIHVGNPVRGAEQLNIFFDSLYKTIAYLDEYYSAVKKGRTPWQARDQAGAAASTLMQNWDNFTPIERQLVQRVYPFWGFRKAMMRTIITYPMDHPIRMQFMYQISRDIKERQDLPDEWKNKLAISGMDKNGKQYWISLQGLNPMSDVADVFTRNGFLKNLHPFARTVLETFGVEGYRAGVPTFTYKGEVETDPYTGQNRRRIHPGEAILRLVPQVVAISEAVKNLIGQGVPAPDADTKAGWMAWFDKYGSELRIVPGISYRSQKEAAEKFKQAQKTAASFNKPSKPKPTPRPQRSGTTSGHGIRG